MKLAYLSDAPFHFHVHVFPCPWLLAFLIGYWAPIPTASVYGVGPLDVKGPVPWNSSNPPRAEAGFMGVSCTLNMVSHK